jgi:hypothetical protein
MDPRLRGDDKKLPWRPFTNSSENEAEEHAPVPLNPDRKKDDLANRLPAVMPGLTRHPETYCHQKQSI